MKKSSILLIAIILIIVLLAINSFFIPKYKPFTFDQNNEVNSCKSCKCIGVVVIMESYPEQYSCSGWEFCEDLDLSECP